jgi:cytochrome c oxidase subunit 3
MGSAAGLVPRTGLMWLGATLAFGFAFVAGQYVAWRDLAAQGVYLATSPNSSFFYVFTGVHAVHVLGGLTALLYLVSRIVIAGGRVRRSAFDSTATYWHFMGVLWIYLLLLIRMKL